jgi:hypothetical protein
VDEVVGEASVVRCGRSAHDLFVAPQRLSSALSDAYASLLRKARSGVFLRVAAPELKGWLVDRPMLSLGKISH